MKQAATVLIVCLLTCVGACGSKKESGGGGGEGGGGGGTNVPVVEDGIPKDVKWYAVFAERNGQFDNDPVDGEATIFFSGDRVTISLIDSGKERVIGGTYKLDPAKSPKEIDLIVNENGKSVTQLGVYSLEPGVLHLYLTEPPQPRPTELSSRPGSKTTYIRFRSNADLAKAEVARLRENRKREPGSQPTREEVARLRIRLLTQAVQTYYVKYGEYPQELSILTKPPEGKAFITEADLMDPWGMRYRYDPTGPNHNGKEPDIWTEVPGTKPAQKISNWQK